MVNKLSRKGSVRSCRPVERVDDVLRLVLTIADGSHLVCGYVRDWVLNPALACVTLRSGMQ